MTNIAENYVAQMSQFLKDYNAICATKNTKELYRDIMNVINEKLEHNMKMACYLIDDKYIEPINLYFENTVLRKHETRGECVKILPLMIYITRKMKQNGFAGTYSKCRYYDWSMKISMQKKDCIFNNRNIDVHYIGGKMLEQICPNDKNILIYEDVVITPDNAIYYVPDNKAESQIQKPHINMSIQQIIKTIEG